MDVHELLPEEIMSVTLAATRVAPLTARSTDLFGSPRANANGVNVSDATVLIDKLIARLGGESLQGICVVDDHRPEHAWEPCSIASKRPPAVELPRRKRPMWLFEPPRAVNPSRFEILSGPERIETGWWESGFARDYYIAVDRDGARCWLYNDSAQANWFLHGYFS